MNTGREKQQQQHNKEKTMTIKITIYYVITRYTCNKTGRVISKTKTVWNDNKVAQCYAMVKEAMFINHQDKVRNEQSFETKICTRTVILHPETAARAIKNIAHGSDAPTTKRPVKLLKSILAEWNDMGTDHRGRQLPSDLSRFEEALMARRHPTTEA